MHRLRTMCGGCNIYAESAGVSLIVARYWWVARQGRKAVAEAEAIVREAPVDLDLDVDSFVDPLPEVSRVV